MISLDLPPKLILPDHYQATRPAIIRPVGDLASYFPVELDRKTRLAIVADLVRRGDIDKAAIPFGMFKGASGPTDSLYSNVQLLLHGEGTNASKTFTDNSPSPKTISAFGTTPEVSTTQFKFGTASIRGNGNGYLQCNSQMTLTTTTGDFTIEMWVRPSGQAGIGGLIDFRAAGSGTNVYWSVLNSTQIILGGNAGTRFTLTVTANAWSHIAASRVSGNLRAFLNGTQVGSTYTTAFNLTGGGSTCVIGTLSNAINTTGTNKFIGHIDDLRVTNAGRYSANFTAPTLPFPDQ
jgi:hypothetical protein